MRLIFQIPKIKEVKMNSREIWSSQVKATNFEEAKRKCKKQNKAYSGTYVSFTPVLQNK